MSTAWLLAAILAGGQLVDPVGRPMGPLTSSFRDGALETRPIWDRPTPGPTLQQRTEAALDRGNGRITDQATFELGLIAVSQGRAREWWGYRTSFVEFEAVWDRQQQIDRLERQNKAKADSVRKVEIESETLAGERERWMLSMNRPKHAEAAVIERQALDRVEKEYAAKVESAAGRRDAALKSLEADTKLSPAEKSALRAEIGQRYEQRVRSANLARQQNRGVILGTKGE